MERSRVGIVVPALNEAATIAAVVERISHYGQAIVVDDGSTDATAELARQAGADVVSHKVNQGYDGALNTGFARAAELGVSYIITIDADGQHNPAQLREMIDLLEQGNELVLGVRDRFQRIGETIYGFCGGKLWKMRDPMCGMKGYAMSLYKQAGRFDRFGLIGSELAARSLQRGCRHAEMAIITRDRADEPRFGRTFKANYRILRAMLLAVFLYWIRPAA